MDRFTEGISPKAVLAFLYPFVAGLVVIVAHFVVSGEFDVAEVRLIGGNLLLALSAALGAYVGKPGKVYDHRREVLGE